MVYYNFLVLCVQHVHLILSISSSIKLQLSTQNLIVRYIIDL